MPIVIQILIGHLFLLWKCCNDNSDIKIFSGFRTTSPTIRRNGEDLSVFITNYYIDIPNADREIELVLYGMSYRTVLLFGTYNAGIYECAPYYLQTKDIDGVNHRYPSSGFLLFTINETKCQSWIPEPTDEPNTIIASTSVYR